MVERIAEVLSSFNKEAAVVILGALPIAELRGAIPLAVAMGFSPLKAFALSVLGNMIPVVPVLFLFQPISEKLRHIKIFRKFFDWVSERTKNNADLIERFEAFGLMLFVAVPLPMTGAWSGCIAASLFKIRFRYAFAAIFAGVVIAGIIVLAVSVAGKEILTMKH